MVPQSVMSPSHGGLGTGWTWEHTTDSLCDLHLNSFSWGNKCGSSWRIWPAYLSTKLIIMQYHHSNHHLSVAMTTLQLFHPFTYLSCIITLTKLVVSCWQFWQLCVLVADANFCSFVWLACLTSWDSRPLSSKVLIIGTPVSVKRTPEATGDIYNDL